MLNNICNVVNIKVDLGCWVKFFLKKKIIIVVVYFFFINKLDNYVYGK